MRTFDFLLKTALKNGVVLLVIPTAISLGLWQFLPPAYSPEVFGKNVPSWLATLEAVLRITVFIFPLFMYSGNEDTLQKRGWFVYSLGILLYFLSYLALTLFPSGAWSSSLPGFTAPAWTPAFWLAGIGMVCKKLYFPLPWSRIVYVLLSACFLTFHLWHAIIVYGQNY